jgi:hypothetical protein
MATAPSFKKLQIDKATRNMVIAASIASFITIFCLIAGRSLVTLLNYQNKVITARQSALNQLNTDISAAKQLTSSYNNFNSTAINLLGAPSTGNTGNNGNNAKIVLDALPSQYDFPALATSLQALLSIQGVSVTSIGGNDDSANNQSSAGSSSSAPVAIPFSFTVSGPYQNVQNLLVATQNSIRPIQIQSLSITGDQSNLILSASAQTFYQPPTKFNITSGVVPR